MFSLFPQPPFLCLLHCGGRLRDLTLLLMRAESEGEKKRGLSFHVNTKTAPIRSQLPAVGGERGRASQWHVWGMFFLCLQTQEGKSWETQLICILLWFQRRQNVLERQSHDRVTHRGLLLTYREKKKRRSGGNGRLESGTSWKPLLCNEVKPGRVYGGESERHVKLRREQTKTAASLLDSEI